MARELRPVTSCDQSQLSTIGGEHEIIAFIDLNELAISNGLFFYMLGYICISTSSLQ